MESRVQGEHGEREWVQGLQGDSSAPSRKKICGDLLNKKDLNNLSFMLEQSGISRNDAEEIADTINTCGAMEGAQIRSVIRESLPGKAAFKNNLCKEVVKFISGCKRPEITQPSQEVKSTYKNKVSPKKLSI